jgi:predicted dehydrogenase
MQDDPKPAVLLIGLGNIGFRHLQGLEPLSAQIVLDGVDPLAAARDRATSQWALYAGSQGRAVDTLTDLNSDYQVAILATPADGREAMIEKVLVDRTVGAMVIEKIAFNAREPFTRMISRLQTAGVQGVVNCPRRLWPRYRALAERIHLADKPVQITVRGSNIGLACNGVHFIDLLQMLAGETEVRLNDSRISAPFPAKREGYYEVFGISSYDTPSGSSLTLIVEADGPEQTEIQLKFGDTSLTIIEATGVMSDERGEIIDVVRAVYQSELTAEVVAKLLASQACGLPDLAVSAIAHNALFDALEPAFDRFGLLQQGRLPIT